MGVATIAEAGRPVVGPAIINDPQVLPVWLDDRAILLNIVLSAGTLIVILVKFIWNTERTRLKKIEEAVEHIPAILTKLSHLDGHVKNLPSKDQVELMILLKLVEDKRHEGKRP